MQHYNKREIVWICFQHTNNGIRLLENLIRKKDIV